MSYLFTNGRPPYHEITPYDENKWFEEAGQLQKKTIENKNASTGYFKNAA